MLLEISQAIWLDPLVFVTLAGVFYVTFKDVFKFLSRGHRDKRKRQEAREERLDFMLRDWNGEPARDGVEARPSVMSRLASMDHELNFNSGHSIKDAVTRTDNAVAELTKTFNEHLEWSKDFQRDLSERLDNEPRSPGK